MPNTQSSDAGSRVFGKSVAGFVAELSDTTSSVGTTTTEVVSTSISFTAYANVRYKVTYIGNCESTGVGDSISIKLRWKNSGVADITGAQFATAGHTAYTAGHGRAFVLTGTFDAQLAGTVTVVSTIQRGPFAGVGGSQGTGTARQNAASNSGQLYFLVEICP